MNKDRYSIIFNSKTGNTRKLADAIHEALPQENCDLFGAVEGDVPASETLYIEFWTDKGEKSFYLGQPDSVAVKSTSQISLTMSKSLLMRAMPWLGSICARAGCRAL